MEARDVWKTVGLIRHGELGIFRGVQGEIHLNPLRRQCQVNNSPDFVPLVRFVDLGLSAFEGSRENGGFLHLKPDDTSLPWRNEAQTKFALPTGGGILQRLDAGRRELDGWSFRFEDSVAIGGVEEVQLAGFNGPRQKLRSPVVRFLVEADPRSLSRVRIQPIGNRVGVLDAQRHNRFSPRRRG